MFQKNVCKFEKCLYFLQNSHFFIKNKLFKIYLFHDFFENRMKKRVLQSIICLNSQTLYCSYPSSLPYPIAIVCGSGPTDSGIVLCGKVAIWRYKRPGIPFGARVVGQRPADRALPFCVRLDRPNLALELSPTGFIRFSYFSIFFLLFHFQFSFPFYFSSLILLHL